MENVLYFILKKFFPFLRKSDCEILPLNIMWEIFFFKNHAENKGGEIVPDLLFLKKLCMREKQVVFTLVLKYCDSPPLGHTIKKLYETRDLIQRLNFDFFRKRLGTSFSSRFYVWFFKKNVSHVIFYYLTRFNFLITCTFWDIGQYVYWTVC